MVADHGRDLRNVIINDVQHVPRSRREFLLHFHKRQESDIQHHKCCSLAMQAAAMRGWTRD